jgi:hypothetical protein
VRPQDQDASRWQCQLCWPVSSKVADTCEHMRTPASGGGLATPSPIVEQSVCGGRWCVSASGGRQKASNNAWMSLLHAFPAISFAACDLYNGCAEGVVDGGLLQSVSSPAG